MHLSRRHAERAKHYMPEVSPLPERALVFKASTEPRASGSAGSPCENRKHTGGLLLVLSTRGARRTTRALCGIPRLRPRRVDRQPSFHSREECSDGCCAVSTRAPGFGAVYCRMAHWSG